ncbi:hypothetical protein JCM10296v2_003237 [Rhodotorula toruloides]
MPVTLPLELALQVVDRALPRRLDESRSEHLARLKRIGLVCKAFNEAVGNHSRTVRVTFRRKGVTASARRLKKAEAEGRPVEVVVVSGEHDDPCEYLWMHGKTIVSITYVGEPDFTYGAGDFSAKDFPALRALSFTIPPVDWPRARPVELIAVQELVLAFPNIDLLKDILHPATAPHLRRLGIHQLRLPWNGLHEGLADTALNQRLELCQVNVYGAKAIPSESLVQYGITVPTLLVVEPYQYFPGASSSEVNSQFPFIQLQSVPSPVPHPKRSRKSNKRSDIFDSLTAAIAGGAGRKAVFFPLDLRPSSGRTFEPDLLPSRDRLLAVIEECNVEHVGWYRADQRTDASISEPFRRYLDRERLEGRM